MDTFSCLMNILDEHERSVEESQKKKEPPRPGFAEILDAKNRRAESKKVTAVPKQPEPEEKQESKDFSMYKLYLSLLMKNSGGAPSISPSAPDSSSIMNEKLMEWQSGSRRPFSRDSDLYSTPRFPIVRFMKV